MIPLKILNRLQLGREVSAEVEATLPGHRAWILVWPRVDPEHGYFNKLSDYGEPLVSATSDQNPLKGFEIICMEIERNKLDAYLNNGWEIPYSAATLYGDDFARDEAELEAKVSRRLPDLSLLRIPHDAGFPFC